MPRESAKPNKKRHTFVAQLEFEWPKSFKEGTPDLVYSTES